MEEGLENIYRFLVRKENILDKNEDGNPFSAEDIGSCLEG